MDFRGLSRSEQRRLDEIEQRLGQEAPEVVSAFHTTPLPADDAGRGGFIVVAALIALVGLLVDLPLVVVCCMTGAVAALLLPRPGWMTVDRDPAAIRDRGPEPPGPVPLG